MCMVNYRASYNFKLKIYACEIFAVNKKISIFKVNILINWKIFIFYFKCFEFYLTDENGK